MENNTMAKTKKNAVREEFIYLNRLRESGVTNMFGAAPWVEEAFDIPKSEARKVLFEWMAWADESPDNLNL